MNGDDRAAIKHWEKQQRAERRDLERLIEWYFGPSDSRMAKWVAWNVSHMEPLAFHRNGGAGVGLFQIDPADAGIDAGEGWLLHNPIRNVAAAHRIHAKHGWGYWSVPPLTPAFEETE